MMADQTKINTSTEAVERLADRCREEGNIAHTQPGRTSVMSAFWSAEEKLRALAAERDKLLEAGNKLSFAAQTSGGVAGCDAGLVEAISDWEEALKETGQ